MSAHRLLSAVTSTILGRAGGQWRVRRGRFAVRQVCGQASKCLCIDWYSQAPACWLQSGLSAGPAACLATGRSCRLLAAAFSFPPVEETINHWWVLYLNDSAAPSPREPGCEDSRVIWGNNSLPFVPCLWQQSVQKPCGLVDWTWNPGSLFSKLHSGVASLPCSGEVSDFSVLCVCPSVAPEEREIFSVLMYLSLLLVMLHSMSI